MGVPSSASMSECKGCHRPKGVHASFAITTGANSCDRSEIHLGFDIVSFYIKGRALEKHFGGLYFAYILSVFTVLTSVTHVGLAMALTRILNDDKYYDNCVVGFSGVIVSLKVLTITYHLSEIADGPRIASQRIRKYVILTELFLLCSLTPPEAFFENT